MKGEIVPGTPVPSTWDVELAEGIRARQRAIAERLLLSALRDQEAALKAVDARDRAAFLAGASYELSMSLDEHATRETVRRLTLPRVGTWCIVDVVEADGAMHRLAAVHPDPEKQALARTLEGEEPLEIHPFPDMTSRAPSESSAPEPVAIVTIETGAAVLRAAHGPENLRILREIGFGALLVVPLIVRGKVQGRITFVSAADDPPFTPTEISLAGDLAGRCAMALDNARLYREADGLRLAAEAANQSKSRFLGSMSHELRTPLNAIGGFADLMDMGIRGPVTPEQRVALARIKANQQHLLTLITEILDFVRAEGGSTAYSFGEVSIRHAFLDVVDMLNGIFQKKGLTVEGPMCDDDVVAWADAGRVRQVILNLVTNALKYTHRGTITLGCGVVDDAVRVHVSDTGIGIAPEKLELIFEPFHQLSDSLPDREGGVGLGLAISRDLARAMSGEITAESQLGRGSRFTLTLPRAPR